MFVYVKCKVYVSFFTWVYKTISVLLLYNKFDKLTIKNRFSTKNTECIAK